MPVFFSISHFDDLNVLNVPSSWQVRRNIVAGWRLSLSLAATSINYLFENRTEEISLEMGERSGMMYPILFPTASCRNRIYGRLAISHGDKGLVCGQVTKS